MRKQEGKINKIKILMVVAIIVGVVLFITNISNALKNSMDSAVVVNGSLSYEEQAEGYIIRDEQVLQGQNYENGMVQILSDGERAAKGEQVFRYYSDSEDKIISQIKELDTQINSLIEKNAIDIRLSDVVSKEKQIEDTINAMHNLNYIQEIQDHKNKIDADMSKKAQITGMLSPENSELKQLTNKRTQLEQELTKDSEVITAPKSGLASYRIDGLEDILKCDNFDYLTTEILEGFNLKVGATIPLSNEKGKIVDSFKCYIAIPMKTEKASIAEVGDKVTLRFSNTEEVKAELVFNKKDGKTRILVFEIDKYIAELVEYRKISVDVIWWKYSGLKVSNKALIEENDKTYVIRNRAGYPEKILVKVLRQNDTYSIVSNYTEEELKELGYPEDKIQGRTKIKLYDELILH